MWSVIEFLNAERETPNHIHERLKNVYGNETVYISTVRTRIRLCNEAEGFSLHRSGSPTTATINELLRISVLSLFPSFSLPGVLCDPTDLIWRK